MRVNVRYYFILTSINFQAYCNFTIFVAVIQFVISLFQFVRFLKFFYKGRDSTFLSAFVDVIVCAFMTIMTLTAALFVTLGFKVWCEVRYMMTYIGLHGLRKAAYFLDQNMNMYQKTQYKMLRLLSYLSEGPGNACFKDQYRGG